MKFSTIEVIKTKENFHYIEWDVKSDPLQVETVDDYFFSIYYSRDPYSGFAIITCNDVPISIKGSTGPLAYIHRIKQKDFNQEFYYRIRLTNEQDATKTFLSDSIYIGNQTDGAHETMKHAEETLYSYYSGEPTFIVKKKVTGSRCPKCWSTFRQQRLITNCDVCHGSGFSDGYYYPIKIQLAYDANPKKSDLQETTEDTTNFLRGRLTNYPLVRPKDIIVNINSYKRYLIVTVDITKLPVMAKAQKKLSDQNYVLSQILTMKEINPSDPQYHIPLPEDAPSIDEGNCVWLDGGDASLSDYILYVDGNPNNRPLYIDGNGCKK